MIVWNHSLNAFKATHTGLNSCVTLSFVSTTCVILQAQLSKRKIAQRSIEICKSMESKVRKLLTGLCLRLTSIHGLSI